MECQEKGCDGEVDLNNTVPLQTGCGGCRGASFSSVNPCKKCGRLHFCDGSLVFGRDDKKVFLKNDKIVKED